ncbi:RagB/SusD family nutrient uptake outer membrane protein [Mesonia sp.]|uniref:RagB/SusD family nutrient uptake outer membrane protein n=1 Tax=Mesonia sp. TaxID=1960830 RepID=UPI00175996BF|nr:RagB/SusD family nutrient uptake outer membrane protein [Mesonia sp.]HIB36002.1 RagB/SusD family nutrient uptake outer membrane protein [Mesonia sp.]HIO26323.1 RagB/SusD family nutrient uptake outer membrane protein [Flavobacteriaceae bacterium]
MKKTYKLLVLLGLSISIFSCSDEFDTRTGQLNTGDLDYTDASEMSQALVGAYNAFSTRGWEEPILLSVRGDDVNSGGLGDQQPYADTDNYIYNNSYWMYNSLWNLHYSDIITLNTAILQLERYREFTEGDDDVRAQQYIAEVKVLRAWLHLNLARTWEDVFIYQTNNPFEEIEANGVSSKEEVMQFISNQMDEAIPHLPNLRPNERTDFPGGVTSYTAYALKALANLELENYQEVANATGEIINSGKFSLYQDFYQLFKTPGELSDESLLEIQFDELGSEVGGTFYHLYAPFGPVNWSPARINASSGWGFFEPSMKYIKFMLDRDETTRLETSVLFTDRGITELNNDGYTDLPDFVNNTTQSGDVINDFERALFSSGKHYLPSVQVPEEQNNYGAGKNYIVIRYAEVLLMYAESLTRGASGSAGSALEAVNEVRSRANMPSLSGVTAEDVMDEKYAEFAMEWGIRYYDMIRLDNYSELSYDGRTFSQDLEYLPYPQEQVDALPISND